MKVELVALNSKYIHSNPALYSLYSYAVKEHPEFADIIKITEYTINNRKEDILKGLYRERADVIAISCYIWNFSMVKELLYDIHTIMPDTWILLGGPEASYQTGEIYKEFPFIKAIMVGEGEVTFLKLMELIAFAGKYEEKLKDISGLSLKDLSTGERELADLSTVPFIYDDLTKFKNRIIYYESSRGCPYRCSYCMSSIDKTTRFRDVSLVKKELQYFLDHKVPQVKFVDRTFNCNHEHAYAIWQYIHENDNGVTNFHFEIAADILKEDELLLLNRMRPGLVQLEIGVQTTNEETLREIDRYMNISKLKEIVKRLKENRNIHIHLDLIAGLPREDYLSFVNSFNEVYMMQPHQLQLGFLKVLKGSKMYDMAEEYGLIYSKNAPYEVIRTDWISYEEILSLKEVEEMVEMYYNSCQYRHIIPLLVKESASPFAFYRELADYYLEKGYDVNTPSRIGKYMVLLEFAVMRHPEREDLYKEALIFDLYLRENLKARPPFADGQKEYAAIFREFFRDSEKLDKYLADYKGYEAAQMYRMTHMEAFKYPVWKMTEDMDAVLSDQCNEVHFILFDYKERDPIYQDALYVKVMP